MFGRLAFSGSTSWMNWWCRPRLNSAVHSVAVLTLISLCLVFGFMVVCLSRSPARAPRAEAGLEEIEIAALVGLQDVRPNIQP